MDFGLTGRHQAAFAAMPSARLKLLERAHLDRRMRSRLTFRIAQLSSVLAVDSRRSVMCSRGFGPIADSDRAQPRPLSLATRS